MDENVTFDYLMDEYMLPAQMVPLSAWSTPDLLTLAEAIDAEFQRRYDADNALAKLSP